MNNEYSLDVVTEWEPSHPVIESMFKTYRDRFVEDGLTSVRGARFMVPIVRSSNEWNSPYIENTLRQLYGISATIIITEIITPFTTKLNYHFGSLSEDDYIKLSLLMNESL